MDENIPVSWCEGCPLRRHPGFQDFSDIELDFMATLKAEHRRMPAGTDLFSQGEAPTHIYTVFSGWAYRYRLLGDGRRQILNIVLPGDLLGLPGAAGGRHPHSVRAVTDAEFCALSLSRLPELVQRNDTLPLRLLWLASQEHRMLERLIVAMGLCTTEEAVAGIVVELRDRLERRGMAGPDGLSFECPLSQSEIADHIGVTVVHLNRVLRALEARRLLRFRRGLVEILDKPGLVKLSCLHEAHEGVPEPIL